jgi:hypothetical protein
MLIAASFKRLMVSPILIVTKTHAFFYIFAMDFPNENIVTFKVDNDIKDLND